MTGSLLSLVIVVASLLIGGWVLWPETGLWARLRRGRSYAQRVLREDALKHLYKHTKGDSWPTLESIAGALQITTNEVTQVLLELETTGLVERIQDRYQLTWEGEQYALHIIRAHRLWERYLADHTGFSEMEWHRQAERMEHQMTVEDVASLSTRLGHPTHDPHGDPIPTSSGELFPLPGQSLTVASSFQTLRIVHIEDEPEVLYAQILAEGLHPGDVLQVVSNTPQAICLETQGREIHLAPIVAGNIQVEVVEKEDLQDHTVHQRLSSLQLGESAVIQQLSPALRGLERRRLLDLGFLPGTSIEVELQSPSYDPVGYRVRGTLVGLRREQAEHIWIQPSQEETVS